MQLEVGFVSHFYFFYYASMRHAPAHSKQPDRKVFLECRKEQGFEKALHVLKLYVVFHVVAGLMYLLGFTNLGL